MNVILLEKVRNLGDLGEQVNVKAGYGRNYLIPNKKAVFATPANVERFEARRSELEKAAAEQLREAQARADALAPLTVTIQAKAGDEGKLFGSIGTQDIASAVTEAGVSLHKSEVRLPLGALRQIGEYDIQVQLHSDVSTSVKVAIVAAD